MSKYIKCPRCRCTDLYVVEDNRNDAGRCLSRCGNRNLFRIKRLWCTVSLCGKIRKDYMCGFGYKLENQIQIGKTEKRLSG